MGVKIEFLSNEWLTQVEEIANAHLSNAGPVTAEKLATIFAEIYEDAPAEVASLGDAAWTLEIKAGRAVVRRGAAADAKLILTMNWDDAARTATMTDPIIRKAEQSQMMMDGRILITGAPAAASASLLAGIKAAMAQRTVVTSGASSKAAAAPFINRTEWSAADLPQPTDDPLRVVADVRKWGYAIMKDVISPDEVASLRERLEEQAAQEVIQNVAWLGNGGRGGNTWIGGLRDGEPAPWQGVRTLLNKGRVFIDLAMNQKILSGVRAAFNHMDFYLGSTNGLIVRKSAAAMVVHCDQQYVPCTTPIPFAINVMITLSNFTSENGATRMVPGSHKGPAPLWTLDTKVMDNVNPEPIETVPAICPPGCAIFMDGRLWHSSGASVSDETRVSVTTYYTLPFIRQAELYPLSIHDAVHQTLTKEELAMFGFKTYGALGRIDGLENGSRGNTDANFPFISELRATD